ncbi:MAG TPA: choice-of-anchor L domain-containing protein, partial [Flavobacterium sp.]
MKRILLLITVLLMSAAAFAQANIAVSNTDYQNSYIPGTTNTYTVAVTNFGPNPATNISVSNPIPAGITYFSWVGSNGSSGINNPLTNTIGNLAVGAIVTYTITIEVPAAYAGNLVNQTTISSAVADPNTANNVAIDTDIPGAGADVTLVNTNNQSVYIAGSTVTYTVTVTNNGPMTAANVHVTNPIPAGITQFSWTGSNGSNGTNIPIDNTITSLLAGASVVYTVTVQIPSTFTGNLTSTATFTSPTVDPVPGCAQCTDTDTQGFGADLVVVNSDGQTTYVAGETNTYTLTVTNNGPAVATNVHVVNAIPAGITSFSWTGSNGTSGTNVDLDDTIASLANGQVVTYTVTLDVPASYSGNLTSQATVTSDTIDPNPACAQCSDTDTQITGADLEVVNTDGDSAYFPGTTNVYTVTVTNNGPFDATNVHVTNAIPAGITQFSWTGSNGSSGTNVPLDNTIATLAEGATVTYTITIQIPAGYTGNLTSTANVTSSSVDPTPACLQCSDTDVPAVGADLVVTKSDGAGTYTAGTNAVYFISITNNGPSAAVNVNVQDIVPAGITPSTVTWTGPNGAGSGNINETFATVTVGQTLNYTVTVPIPANYDQTANLVNSVAVTSDTSDPNPECPACTDTDTPFPSANLTVLKSDAKTTFINDSDITYNIIISNNGPSNANEISVTDLLPAGVTVMNWLGSNGSSGTGPLSDIIATLAPGEFATYQVTIHVPANYDLTHPTLVNSVTVDAVTPDPVPACPGCTDTDTPAPNWVTVNTTTYSPQELVEDVLIHSDCADVSNFTWQLGPGNIGAGYFHRNNSDFPLEEGVVIVCGTAPSVAGPWAGGTPSDNASGVPDAPVNQLQQVSNANGQTGTVSDANGITFTFVPLTTNFSFNFLFASAEYGTYQCFFSDVFAFILTDVTAGTPFTNIANIPGTSPPIPVSVTTIRDTANNGGCGSANVEFFDLYNPDNPGNAAINMNGQTVPMVASATVIPNHVYTIKLIIGDYSDTALNSAVFIEAGSFNVGQASITGSGPFASFPDLTIENGAAVCDGLTTTIQAGASPIAGATYQWEQNDVVIPGETGYQLVVDEPAIYTVNVSIGSGASGCSQTDSIIVEYLPAMPIETPSDLFECGNFNLSETEAEMLNGQNPTGYVFMYHHTLSDAQNVFNEIVNYTDYPGVDGETIYVSIQDLTNDSGCIGVRQFNLQVTTCGTPVTPPDLYVCDDPSNDGEATFDLTPQIAIALGTNDPNLYQITFHHSPGNATNGNNPIDPAAFVNNQNCDTVWVRMENINDPSEFAITQFQVCVLEVPEAPTPGDITACDSYTLPALPSGQTYADASGASIPVGTIISTSQVITVIAESGTTPNCTAEGSFVLTIVETPPVPAVTDVIACDNYTLPILPAGHTYNSASGGNPATAIPSGAVITTTQTIWEHVSSGTTPACTSEASFTITINETPVAPNPADVFECDSYTLPALPAGQSYHQGTAGGTLLPAGTIINTTQTIVIVDETGTTPNCTSEGNFIVTITQTPPTPVVQDVTACDNYTLPSLPAGHTYNSAPGGNPATVIPVGTIITATQIIWDHASSGTTPDCTSEASFTVTINNTPATPIVQDVVACDSYALPTLPAGQSYHEDTASGAIIPVGTAITTTQTIVVVDETNTTPNCTSEASFTVTINDTPPAPVVQDVTACDSYTLPALPAGHTYNSAPGGNPATEIPAGSVITATQDIWEHAESGTTPNCTSEASFTVTINITPAPPVVADIAVCDTYTLPGLPAGQSYHEGTATGAIIPVGTIISATQTIVVVDETGTTPNCTSEASFTVTINNTPPTPVVEDVIACDSYTLPVLPAGHTYNSAPGGNPATQIPAGTVITASQIIWDYVESGTTPNCTSEASFTITINQTPVAPNPADVSVCDAYTLPVLPAGQSYHEGTANGALIPVGTVISTTQTIIIVDETGTTPNCTSEGDFVVTITPTPAATELEDVTACDSYQLPVIAVGNYFDEPNAAGQQYFAGDIIDTTNTIYIFAQSGTTPNCTSESSFTVTIHNTPATPVVSDVTACDSYTLPELP